LIHKSLRLATKKRRIADQEIMEHCNPLTIRPGFRFEDLELREYLRHLRRRRDAHLIGEAPANITPVVPPAVGEGAAGEP
jgi:hypothetical protein